MGRREKSNIKYTEDYIVSILENNYLQLNSVKYQMSGLYVFAWESDYLALTKSGLLHEIEVKISRADFKKDFEKTNKHLILSNQLTENKFHRMYLKPNFFYYAVPKNLITIDEVPAYAGLIYIDGKFPFVNIVKRAPYITKEKIELSKLNLEEKFYYNMLSWKKKAIVEYKNKLDDYKQRLDESRLDENGNKFKYNLVEANNRIKELESMIDSNYAQIDIYKNIILDDITYYRAEIKDLKEKLKETKNE